MAAAAAAVTAVDTLPCLVDLEAGPTYPVPLIEFKAQLYAVASGGTSSGTIPKTSLMASNSGCQTAVGPNFKAYLVTDPSSLTKSSVNQKKIVLSLMTPVTLCGPGFLSGLASHPMAPSVSFSSTSLASNSPGRRSGQDSEAQFIPA